MNFASLFVLVVSPTLLLEKIGTTEANLMKIIFSQYNKKKVGKYFNVSSLVMISEKSHFCVCLITKNSDILEDKMEGKNDSTILY